MPGLYYKASTTNQRILNFLNDPAAGTPPYFEGYNVTVCDASDAECMSNCYSMTSSAYSSLSISKFYSVAVVCMAVLALHVM